MPRYLFITGKLAEPSVREVLTSLAPQVGFEYELLVLNITVAALMTPEWIARRITIPPGVEHIYVPGACSGDWSLLEKSTGLPVTAGPADVRDLPDLFGHVPDLKYGEYDIQIIAEINHAPEYSRSELLHQAGLYQSQGADLIDLGCIPGTTWSGLSDAVRSLRDAGLRVSIDTFNLQEASAGAQAGAELILSVNSSNREASRDWGCEVVAIPDAPGNELSLEATIEYLLLHKIRHRLDPILEPIGFGFGSSLLRYYQSRQKYPRHDIMMGTGNITELTETDSAPINLLLMSLCQEWGIRSILTTSVANYACTSVLECDIARRLAFHAINQKRLPKKVDRRLLTLRDRRLRTMGEENLNLLAGSITDPNYRLFAESGKLHAMNGQHHVSSADPFLLFEQLCNRDPSIDSSHAFYLGFELCKAYFALQLSKNYVQDQSLDWGYLTVPEQSHRDRQRQQRQGEGHATG